MTRTTGPISDELPMFLTVADLQRLLHVSRSEAYGIAHTIGVTRIGPRLIRIAREAFLRWRAERVAESETDRRWGRRPFPGLAEGNGIERLIGIERVGKRLI